MKRGFQDWSVYKKSLLLGLLPSGLMFACLVFFFTTVRLSEARTDLIARGQLIADQLAPAVEYDVISGNTGALEKLLGKVAQSPLVHHITIHDSFGNLMAEIDGAGRKLADADETPILLSADILQSQIELENDAFASFASEFQFTTGPSRIGKVEVAITESVIIEGQHRIIYSSFTVAALLMFLTYLLIRNMARSIANPIEQLTAGVELIKNGDYRTRAPDIRGLELSRLRDSINQLAVALEKASLEQTEHLGMIETARNEAESASKAKSEFLAIMSHELRTPMNGVLGMLQLLQETQQDEEQKEYTHVAMRSTEHLIAIIDDILDFSKIERGRLSIDPIEFNLRSLVEETLNAFRPQVEEKGLLLHQEYEGELQDALVTADPARIRQVLANLINNAIKFTAEGYIRVHANWEEIGADKVCFTCEVEDSGIGIAPEQQRRMFSSFQQADQSNSRRYGGTGLGLAIAKRLLELMEGEIFVESESGKGSCFKFALTLHYRRSPDGASWSAPAAGPIPQFQGRVLIVEDNQVNQKVTCGILNKLGIETENADNGEEALQKVRGSKYDLIFMDCQMPVMDGYQATAKIRQMESRAGVKPTPIVALTANALEGAADACRKAGMDDYLSKPIKKQQLVDCLQTWLGESDAENPTPENAAAHGDEDR
ncbi:ATP-binding protein [Hahella sp. NBU794]|uniref:ATP-binding protein n=1 Tax=Hahella sp. NBU794 TaxID=3422590 RepID=UPI003D6E011A